jgi:vacuolar-type H+-ATPase subunit E/Vma4
MVINMLDEENLKKNTGKLGLYMIEDAQQEIKNIQRKILFQKAEIRKDYEERTLRSSQKIREDFKIRFNEILNKSLASTLMDSKNQILQLKNDIIKDLRSYLNKGIGEIIDQRYENYIKFIVNHLKSIQSSIDYGGDIEILFNSRDYEYFSKNFSKIKEIFKTHLIIEKSSEEHIGGFKISLIDFKMIFDNTIDSLIAKNFAEIEMEFSKIISDVNYQKINDQFEETLKNNRKNIEMYLRKYDEL